MQIERIVSMARGRLRPGAGRPKGSLTKRTREIAERALSEGMTPLEVMLMAMRHAVDAGDLAAAHAFAKDAAPYMHARLAAVECTRKGSAPPLIRITPDMSPEEAREAYLATLHADPAELAKLHIGEPN